MPETTESPHLTLTGFLEGAGARLHFYDMGRRVVPIAHERFVAFEKTSGPYPYPMQQKAWFALVQEHAQAFGEPLIWFLRFDLDEQAKLVLATRDYLLQRFLEIASQRPTAADLGEAMRDNPYAFAPREDKMANLHARVHRDLGLGPSQYYAHARAYLKGEPGWEQWSFVGYQGLADIAARQHEDDNAAILSAAIPHLPNEPLAALCQCLENHPPDETLAAALRARLQSAIADPTTPPAILAALLRGQSQATPQQAAEAVLKLLNDDRSRDPEILAAVAGRAWETLLRPDVARAYLERLASEGVGQAIFERCVTDLLRLPELQTPVLEVLRAADRPPSVAHAFQAMLHR